MSLSDQWSQEVQEILNNKKNLSIENIKKEKLIRKKTRKKIKNDITFSLLKTFNRDIISCIIDFVNIPLPISQICIQEIENIFKCN